MRVRNINASDNFEKILKLYRSSYENTYKSRKMLFKLMILEIFLFWKMIEI